jgi:GH24 family phage-related lysozyme (muramidase)
MTADGQGAAALSSIGQAYAYGTVQYRGNGDPGSTSGRRLPRQLQLSSAGTSFIAAFEGFRASPYNDLANNCTIGYGHLIHRGACTSTDFSTWGTITRDRGLTILQADAGSAAGTVRTSVPGTPLHQYEFDALVSLTFNIGAGAFVGSSVRSDLAAQPPNYGAVPTDMRKWVYAGGRPSCGLYRRRVNEGHLFSTGSYAISSPACPYVAASAGITTASLGAEQAAVSATPYTAARLRPQTQPSPTP